VSHRDYCILIVILSALSLAASWGVSCGALSVAREAVRGRR
jgi:hypothetical protein